MDNKPTEWEDRIVLFAAFLIDNNLRSSTVKSYVSALKGILTEVEVEVQYDSFLLSLLTRACKLKNDVVITRLPIHKDLLHLLLNKIESYFADKNQHYLELLYKAIFVASYYGLLRAGEVTQGLHVVLANNVHIGQNKNKFLFILLTSKTHGLGDKPQEIKLARDRKAPTVSKDNSDVKEFYSTKHCPFTILKNYSDARPDALWDDEQFSS